ncbi:MAG: ATP-binding cassette domain-containing protein [Bacteroidota bacterium]
MTEYPTTIQVRGLTIFQHGQPVLQDIHFDITSGEFVFLIGKTGSGKSSLLKTLYADLPTSVGTAKVASFDLSTIERSEVPFLRRRLGIIFQDFQLLTDRNIEENLKFVLEATGWKDKSAVQRKIAEVLTKVGLHWAAKKWVHHLSGGEQQRIAIARSLLNTPLILLADEPTGNLDPEIAQDILALFLEINREGTAVLMATHNYDLLARHPARVLTCSNSRVIDSNDTSLP